MEIKNTKNWCIALSEHSADVKQYEDTLYSFYKSIGDTKYYDNSLMTGCYKKNKFGKIVPKLLFSNLLAKGLIAVTIGIMIFIFSILNLSGDILEKLKEGFSSFTTKALIPIIIALIITEVVHILFARLGFNHKIKNLEKLETNLKPLMKTVPSNYRNSDKMNAIAKIYFTKPTIDPSIILECVDDFLDGIKPTSRFMSVMFDLPCECPFLGVSDSQNSNVTSTVTIDEDGNFQQKNEFLPSDIDTKVVAGSEDADKDLQSMIGLNDVKSQIERLKTRISFYGNNVNNGNHMAFLGSAGTGKTTVARIITKIMYDLGYIKKNQYIEISGDYLCAGSTSRASAIIEYSYGGVLFIDEAYLMYRTGSEVIGVLLKAMEDHREDFIVILAGYEEQMTKLFASNEGFTSRVKHTIYFADYSEEEMLDIFNYFIKSYNNKAYQLDNLAITTLLDAFKLEKKAKSFGNARTVRNAVDMIMDFYADRSIKEKTDTRIIKLPDIEAYYDNRKRVLQHEIKNASAANQLDEQIIRLSELKPRVKNGSENPNVDLNNLVGLESFKTEIDSLKNQKEFYDRIDKQRILLLGEKGCGKTTITKILTGYLYQLGFIEENKYLEIPAEFLKGSFVGHTAKRAEAIISYASGGVLFIKNYNMLCNSDDAFAGEALSAINTALNENPNVTIVIADSPSEHIDAIKSMFTIVYEFPEYTSEQILQIFDTLARNENFTVDDVARERLFTHIESNNSNIRDIQQIWTSTVKSHISKFDGNEQNKYFIAEDELVIPKKIKLKLKT